MFGFHKCNKEGLSRNDDCYKNTQRDVPGGLNNIRGLTCFQNTLHWMAPFQNRSGDSLWQNLLSQLKNCFLLKDLFSKRLCDMVFLFGYRMDLVHSWRCCKTCNELGAFNCTPLWMIDASVILLLSLANLSIQQHLVSSPIFILISLDIYWSFYYAPNVVASECTWSITVQIISSE